MTDILDRLRAAQRRAPNHALLGDAASEIDRLRIAVFKLGHGLPFVKGGTTLQELQARMTYAQAALAECFETHKEDP